LPAPAIACPREYLLSGLTYQSDVFKTPKEFGLTEGYFGFAGHNDPVAFRNLSISAPADK
jgi:hypothetical protein